MLLPPYDQLLEPYAYFATMRREHPIAYDPTDDSWAIYRYDDVRTLTKDTVRFASDPTLADRPIRTPENRPSLIRMDLPDHRRIRGLVAPGFTPARMAHLTSTITNMAHNLIDQVAPTGRMDVIEDLAFPLPVMVIAEMLGIPPADRTMYRRWADMLLGRRRRMMLNMPPSDDAFWAIREMDAYFSTVIQERSRRPQDDLISQWAVLGAAGSLSEGEILSLCSLMLLAGHVTTVNLIGNAVWSLLEWPDQLQRLRRHPELIPAAIEEVLRYRSPVQTVPRITTEEVTIGGHAIPRGKLVTAWIGSANRDETAFPDPDRFNIDRHPSNHIAFGTGIHTCLGAPLGRLEGHVVLRILLERLPDMQLAPKTVLQTSPQFVLFGVKNLPITFSPAQVMAA